MRASRGNRGKGACLENLEKLGNAIFSILQEIFRQKNQSRSSVKGQVFLVLTDRFCQLDTYIHPCAESSVHVNTH